MENKKKYSDKQNEKDLALEVDSVIREINDRRSKVTAKGLQLKSSPYGNLQSRGLMKADYLMQEFNKIQNKQSSLPSGERKCISEIVMTAFQRLMLKRMKEQKESETKTNEQS